MERIVGIGEYAISNRQSDVIKTFALASCVAVTIYSPEKKVAGMIHLALPSPLTKNDGADRPYYFVTIGLPLLLNKLFTTYGCKRENLIINVYGGADSIKDNDQFRIGKRNIAAAKAILEGFQLRINHIETGGSSSRTLEMDVATGKVTVKQQPIRI